MERRRWDTDDRFTGIASGQALAPAIERLRAHCDRDGWITEDPEIHLLTHLRRYCDQPRSPFRLLDARLHDDGVYEVDIEPTGVTQADSLPIRRVLPMLAVIAETALAVRQLDENTIECVTGMLDNDGPYAAHGHLIRLRIRS
ncbi:hypothetical protein MHAE_17213 [Mycobacterium haemophilum DSM 44634]|uniref:hypothetical protein n=1 Tax=Mycobacterium haemophilum TaxID=29311 RepID=UPI0006552C32|nr:hypothetical protein [Mycobacterium haemophilum]AKN16025.1 hypothetical protein B586_04720 [Mycobacterium haemophilum DSM 44634]MCV7341360.1 hypothetical protein [Mycobacterium haemophilum DSM 44634]